MGTSDERRRRKRRKHEISDTTNNSLYSLLNYNVSRRSRKRSRSSSSRESRKMSRHKHKSHSRREERKSKKFHRDIKQEKLDTSSEVFEMSFSPRKHTKIEVITIDDKQSPEIFQNAPKTVSDQIIVAPGANKKVCELSVTRNPENAKTSDLTLEVLENEPEEDSVAKACSKLVEAWQNTLHQGLSSQANEELLKDYRLAEDAQTFKAPTLNRAIKSLLNGTEIVRDEIEMAKQNQLGSLLEAIKMNIYRMVDSKKRSSVFAKVVQTMNDIGNVIAQLHYSLSLTRRMRVTEAIGAVKMDIATRVAETLFTEEEETEIHQRVMELIELAFIDDEVEKRLAAAKEADLKNAEEAKKLAEEKAKEDAKKIAEEKAKKMAEEEAKKIAEEEAKKVAENEQVAEQPTKEEDEEEEDTPCSQRFGTSRNSGRSIFQAKIEGKAVKSEGKVKSEKGTTPKFVPNSDFPGIEEVMRMARERQGFSKNAIPIALKAIAKSTLNSYKTHIQRWWDFCSRESCDTFDPQLRDVMEFLVECSQNGMTLNTLKTARSALSFIVSKDLGKDEYLSVLYKGFSNS